jgi:benzoate membrane transport protein
LCASPDASPEPGKRWIAAATAGAASIVFGLFAGAVTAFASGAPILVEAVAGLALLNPFGSALRNALAGSRGCEAALVAFLITASGVTMYGISGAFWGACGRRRGDGAHPDRRVVQASGAIKPVVAGAEAPWA